MYIAGYCERRRSSIRGCRSAWSGPFANDAHNSSCPSPFLTLSPFAPVRCVLPLPPAGVHALSSFLTVLTFCVACLLSTQLGILRDDGVPIGLSLHECMLMAAVFSAADEVATLSLIKQVRGSVLSVSCLVRSTVVQINFHGRFSPQTRRAGGSYC